MIEFLSPQTPPAPSPLPGAVRSIGIAVIRIGAPLLLAIEHLWPELVAGYYHIWEKQPWPLVGILADHSVPFPQLVAPPAVALAFAACLSLAAGMLARVAALILVGFTAVTLPAAWTSGTAELTVLYGLIFASLVILGPGHLSLDALFSLRKQNPS